MLLSHNVLFCWLGLYGGWNTYNQCYEFTSVNLGLASLSAMLKAKGHYTDLLDCRRYNRWDQINQLLIKHLNDFDCVMIGFHSVDKKFANELIHIIKRINSNIPVVVGGVHVTFEAIKEFSDADCVVWGEGESIIDIITNIIMEKNELPKHYIAPMVENLDDLPFVDRELFGNAECNKPFLPLLPPPFYSIMFSRGCTHQCTFCLQSKQTMWKKYRMRSPQNCIEEIKSLGKVGSLMIHDDLFAGNRKWCEEFIELWNKEFSCRIPFWCQMRGDWICKNKDLIPTLAKMGLTWVSLGIEGSQKMLDLYNKRETVEEIIEAAEILHVNKVNIFGNFILGSPTETIDDINELDSILARIRPGWHSASTYTYYKGSKLADFCEKEGWLVGEDENDARNHYSTTRFPYERKIKNVDYNFINMKKEEWAKKYRRGLLI